MPGGAENKERDALEKLRMLRVAKDLFLTDWYRESCVELGFSEDACRELGDIGEESREERDEALDLIGRWARRVRDDRAEEDAPAHVARAARREFILNLIDVKEASGEVFERAAILAPLGMREDFERLAAIDFRHALRLRQLLVDEVQTEWRERTRGVTGSR